MGFIVVEQEARLGSALPAPSSSFLSLKEFLQSCTAGWTHFFAALT